MLLPAMAWLPVKVLPVKNKCAVAACDCAALDVAPLPGSPTAWLPVKTLLVTVSVTGTKRYEVFRGHVDRTARGRLERSCHPRARLLMNVLESTLMTAGSPKIAPPAAVLRADGLVVDEGAAGDVQGRTEARLDRTPLGAGAKRLVVHERARS